MGIVPLLAQATQQCELRVLGSSPTMGSPMRHACTCAEHHSCKEDKSEDEEMHPAATRQSCPGASGRASQFCCRPFLRLLRQLGASGDDHGRPTILSDSAVLCLAACTSHGESTLHTRHSNLFEGFFQFSFFFHLVNTTTIFNGKEPIWALTQRHLMNATKPDLQSIRSSIQT